MEQNGMVNITTAEVKSLKRSLAVTRVFCVIPTVLFAAILIGGVYLWGQVSGIVEEVLPVAEAADVDWTKVAESLEQVETAVCDVDWKMLSEKVEQFDVETLNRTLGSINADELNEAIKNLNETADTFKKLSSFFK